MSIRTRVALALLAAAVLAAVSAAGSAPASSPSARIASKRCNISGDERKLGPTYVTSLRVKGVSCRTGRRVVRGYYRCRIEAGGRRGRCHSRVLRFRCTERRESISTQFDAQVRCVRGRSRVWHDYTQNT
jgi:hypothetical protein